MSQHWRSQQRQFSQVLSSLSNGFKNWHKVRFHQGEVKLLYKYGTIYREVMHTPTVDACALMDGKYNNKMLDQLVQFMLDSAGPDIIHKCPYTVNKQKRLQHFLQFWISKGNHRKKYQHQVSLYAISFPNWWLQNDILHFRCW